MSRNLERSYSTFRRSKRFVKANSVKDAYSIEKAGRSPYQNTMNDLRDELLKTKRIYAMAIRENSLMRTKLKIAEKECKRREEEIENLLSNKNEQGTSRYEERIQLNSLRKKLLQYERALRVKNEENCQLLADRNILRASEAREMVVKLENECNRLRNHLSQSIPEAEYLREKQQYMHVIEKLTEENMELRKIIGEYEKRRKETEKKLDHLYGGMDLVKEFRNTGIATRKQANFYKSALTSLVQNWRNANSSTKGHYNHHRNHHLLITKSRSNSESAVVARCLAEKAGGGRGMCESTPDSSLMENPMTMASLHKHNSKSSLPIVSAFTGQLKSSRGNNKKSTPLSVTIPTRAIGNAATAKNSDSELIFSRRRLRVKVHNKNSVVTRGTSLDGGGSIPQLPERVGTLPRMYQSTSTTPDRTNSDDSSTLDGSPQAVNGSFGANLNTTSPPHKFNENLSNNLHNGRSHPSTSVTDGETENTPRKVDGDDTENANYLENLEALKLEYTNALEENEQRSEHCMENIIRAVQSHILRVKMYRIREQSLNDLEMNA